jgi:hypothetical protein
LAELFEEVADKDTGNGVVAPTLPGFKGSVINTKVKLFDIFLKIFLFPIDEESLFCAFSPFRFGKVMVAPIPLKYVA